MRRPTVRALIFLIIASAPFLVFAPESSAQESDSLPPPATSEEQHMGVIPGSGGIVTSVPSAPAPANTAQPPQDDSLAGQTNKPPYDAAISQPTTTR